MTTAFVLLSVAQIVHFSRHWLELTRRLRTEARENRLKTHLDWRKKQHRPRVLA